MNFELLLCRCAAARSRKRYYHDQDGLSVTLSPEACAIAFSTSDRLMRVQTLVPVVRKSGPGESHGLLYVCLMMTASGLPSLLIDGVQRPPPPQSALSRSEAAHACETCV